MDRLMIVESPSKAKTIQRYLGAGYKVMASYGHLRDLVPKKGAVEVGNHEVHMKYQNISKNKQHIEQLCAAAEAATTIFLATDPDREGEAIAFHLLEIFKQHINLTGKLVRRVVFHEITQTQIIQAIESSRDLDMNLVNAQQARRALDYLVGFNLSPVLWKKVKPGLSAGRVQSPALRLIADREAEIAKFQSREYWSVHADLTSGRRKVHAKFVNMHGKKLGQFDLNNKDQVDALLLQIDEHGKDRWRIDTIVHKDRKKQPVAPFTTSTLQQEAARKLGLSSAQTMRIAQQLYEGVDVGSDSVALITYLRTDSVTLSEEAIKSIRSEIASRYGKENLPASPRAYKTKSKNAQEAHEAIRPIDCTRTPESLKKHLALDQYKLYDLIWSRTVSSQMVDAIYEDQIITISAGDDYRFEARRTCLKREGFLLVYQEGSDDVQIEATENKFLQLKEGELLSFVKWDPAQHMTEPPHRFNEATLVKALESYGIGRPSTYSSIISTLKQRDYVEFKQKRFTPTDTGVVVNDFLKKYFVNYVDYDFTAQLEDRLDAVSLGVESWTTLVGEFWLPFHNLVEHISEKISKKEVVHEEIDETCPLCQHKLVKKFGRAGRFIGCSHYPECKYTRPIDGSADEGATQPASVDRDCPLCQKPLVYKKGRFGTFIGCSGYPECRHIESMKKSYETGITCPTCNKGQIVGKTSRKGTIFYACSAYPNCKQTYSGKPVLHQCPQCAYPLLIEKQTKKDGKFIACPEKTCDYRKPLVTD
ncbi:MAG: type I DNA topoisomerase [Gammaproteobacteria bacterium]|nr:type I DNA topoisomerase [Gammaproteobacteria bacterium]